MSAYPHAPRLWFTSADRERLRQRLAQKDPVVVALHARALDAVSTPPSPESGDGSKVHATMSMECIYLPAAAILSILTGDPVYAREAYAILDAALAVPAHSDLGKGAYAHQLAIYHECFYDDLEPAQKRRLTRALVDILAALKVVTKGNPYNVGNNWWAITHGGALMAALAADGHRLEEEAPLLDLAEDIAWARGRCLAFCMHFGDAGIYHEGLGYQMYACSNLLPALVALRHTEGFDFTTRFPNFRRMAHSMFLTACARPALEDTGMSDTLGSGLSWNDAGQSWGGINSVALMLALAPEAEQGALRWMYDRIKGLAGDGTFGGGWFSLFYMLLYYPYDHPPVDPNGVLPLSATDNRQGMVLVRDRIRDADDAILGVYARATHVGGHSQDDAASVRWMALGHDWAMGGGQARPQAQYQSRVTVAPAEAQPEGLQDACAKRPTECGHVIWNEPTAAGHAVGLDVRRVLGCHAERYVGAFWNVGGTGATAVAMLDLVDDHRGLAFDWNLTFAPDLAYACHADALGFTLSHADGTRMDARLLGTAPVGIDLLRTPDSSRTYSGGNKVDYPGRPYVCARFAPHPHIGMYVVMVAHRGGALLPARIHGVDVRIGTTSWTRPFGEAVPEGFAPGEGGILCLDPTGTRRDG